MHIGINLHKNISNGFLNTKQIANLRQVVSRSQESEDQNHLKMYQDTKV